MPRTAFVIIVGDEVLAAEVTDRNGPLVLATLARLGTRTLGLRVVPDRLEEIAQAVREGLAAADLVLVTGGIGPTHDDRTRPAVARAIHRPLARHPEASERLQAIFRGRSTDAETAMAELPAESELITSPAGNAFGFRADRVLVFPGVPELLALLLADNEALVAGRPWVRREVPTPLREGELAGAFGALAAAWPAVRWGSYPRLAGGRWELTLVLRAEDEATADRAEEALRAMLAGIDPGNSPSRG